MDIFIKKVFSYGRCDELFSTLCKDGCSRDHLPVLLFDVSSRAVAHHGKLIFDADGLSRKQLTNLSRDLMSIACLVRRVNKTMLNPKFDLLWAPADSDRDPLRQACARLYDMLPGLLQTYSVHLGRFSMFTEANLRRLTFGHFYALRFIRYIRESTGGPRYDDSANLLTAGFLAAGGAESDIPEFFTAEALAKLIQRTAKFR
jgi:hypothetical protein